MGDPVEVELKLEYDPADRDRLIASALLGSGATERKHLIATYFDTPDFQLDKAGYALRIRKDGDHHVQTVKASASHAAGLFVRGEWEREADGDRPVLDEKAGPLHQAIDPTTLEKISPVFVTDVERFIGLIGRADTLIEYAVDAGEVRAGQRSTPLFEIELELKQGSPHVLFDLARALSEEVPLRLGVRSKSGRGYALARGALSSAVKTEPIRLDPEMATGEAFVTIASSCIRQYRLNEALLIQTGATEAVHQARVGLRRLRSAFSLFKPLFADDDKAALLAAELRWLAGELGAIRDIDVLLPRLEGPARTALAAIRERDFEHVRNLLESSRVRMLPIALAEWLAIGAWRGDPAEGSLCDRDIRLFAGERLDRLRKRTKREGRGLARLDDGHRHEVRKDAKKLRYAAEFFVSLYPGRKARRRLDRFLDRLEALQDKLGRLNDFAAGPELLARLGLDIDMPSLGKKGRSRLLDDAEDCFEALIDVKRFWRD